MWDAARCDPSLHRCLTLPVFWQQSADDVSQFDSKFTSQTPVDSPDDSTLSESANRVFLVRDMFSSQGQVIVSVVTKVVL